MAHSKTTIPARKGAHATLSSEQKIRIFNSSGHQVIDNSAFATTSPVPSWMSIAQSRQKLQTVIPPLNATFADTHRNPFLNLVEDTSPGVHDILYPPCDDWRYTEAGKMDHDSCAANLRTELAAVAAVMKRDDDAKSSLVELEEKIRTWGMDSRAFEPVYECPCRRGAGFWKGGDRCRTSMSSAR